MHVSSMLPDSATEFSRVPTAARPGALKNNGITQKEPFAWRLARAANGTLYVLIARRSEDGSIGNAGDGALYRSTDGAEHWQPVTLPAGTNAPNGMAIDPNDSNRLYLTTWARAAGQHGDGGGIFLSEDAGKTWKQVLEKDRHIYDITIDPVRPEHSLRCWVRIVSVAIQRSWSKLDTYSRFQFQVGTACNC